MLPNVTNRQWKTLSLPQSDMPVQDRGRIKEWRIGGGDGEEDLLRSQCGRMLRQLRPVWRFPSHLPQLFHLALPGHR